MVELISPVASVAKCRLCQLPPGIPENWKRVGTRQRGDRGLLSIFSSCWFQNHSCSVCLAFFAGLALQEPALAKAVERCADVKSFPGFTWTVRVR